MGIRDREQREDSLRNAGEIIRKRNSVLPQSNSMISSKLSLFPSKTQSGCDSSGHFI